MSKPVTVVALATAKPGQAAALRAELLKLVPPTRAEEGCIEYALHDNNKDENSFVFVERWASLELLQKHSASEHLQNFRNIAGDILEKLDVMELTEIK